MSADTRSRTKYDPANKSQSAAAKTENDLKKRLAAFRSAQITVVDKLIGQTVTGLFPPSNPPSYRIIHELGKGGVGAVYEAEILGSGGKKAAVKFLSEDYCDVEEIRSRFKREARVMHDLKHPNVVEVHSFGSHGKRMFIVMELLSGRDLLHDILDNSLTCEAAVHIAGQVCDALQAAHEKGVIHRDVKAENVFLLKRRGDDHFVKVLDFGLALSGSQAGEKSRLTTTNNTFGTPEYMAPEQMLSAKAADQRSDIFSLGVLMYISLTGQYPYPGDNLAQVYASMRSAQQPPPPSEASLGRGITKDLDAIVMKAISLRPEDRQQSMAEIRDALDKTGLGGSRSTAKDAGSACGMEDDIHERPTIPNASAPKIPAAAERSASDGQTEEDGKPEADTGASDEASAGTGKKAGIAAAIVLVFAAAGGLAWHLLGGTDPGSGSKDNGAASPSSSTIPKTETK